MLKEDRITPSGWLEEARIEVPVEEEHGDSTCQNGESQQQEDNCDEDRSAEEVHRVEGQNSRSHIPDGGDEVNRPEDGR